MVESGPIPAVHGVVRWRIIDLRQRVWDEFQISVSKQTPSRELQAMGYRKLSARPRTMRRRQAPSSRQTTGLRKASRNGSVTPAAVSCPSTPGWPARHAISRAACRAR
ncbi:MAG: winged helix-turn-helix domain-containing protein [Solirubrobacterales bacterium]|nr:winged helix-turn-helix domain-containing protein [Solirubrobacterales bacterium]